MRMRRKWGSGPDKYGVNQEVPPTKGQNGEHKTETQTSEHFTHPIKPLTYTKQKCLGYEKRDVKFECTAV